MGSRQKSGSTRRRVEAWLSWTGSILRSIARHDDERVDGHGAVTLRQDHERIDVEFDDSVAVRFGEGGDGHDRVDGRLDIARRLAAIALQQFGDLQLADGDRKSTRLNSSHGYISYAVFC